MKLETYHKKIKLIPRALCFNALIFLVAFMLHASGFTLQAQAAEMFFETKNSQIRVGDRFEIGFFLNTEDEDINAIEGKVVFPETLLELKEIRDGNSIINFWIERPKAKNGEIIFSGITPGGYNDGQGLILSIAFLAKKEGDGAIEFSGVKALRNDGQGTEADVKISNFQFLISKQIPIPEIPIPEIKDIEPPEEFTPQIAADPAIFDGKWFLVFATQDKGSGIDHYEIKESRQKFFAVFEKWLPAESPYVLMDQELRGFVWIKAVDKIGNERIAVVEPRYPLKWHDDWRIWSIIILGLFVLAVIGKILWKKRKVRI